MNKYLIKIKSKLTKLSGIYYKKSYSQCGEDIIISHIFQSLNILKPIYIDIGAHHPFYINNTYFFYKSGSRGINIEPDPSLIKKFIKYRKRDINLNIGLSSSEGIQNFYVMSIKTLNTFSEKEAKNLVDNMGHRIVHTIPIDTKTLSQVIDEYLGKSPDLVSIDVEGFDFEILQSLDLKKYSPTVFCIETLTYSENGRGEKITQIEDHLQENGYFNYADTHINTIFVNKKMWLAR